MAYLKTVLTYNQPSEAEVDKSYLESHGLTVCLLNANTSRNELGAPFFIQLQVAEEEYERARSLLYEANPQRFGSAERVADIDRQIKQGIFRFFAAAITVGLIAYFVLPSTLTPRDNVPPADAWAEPEPQDWKIPGAFVLALLAGAIAAYTGQKKSDAKP